MGVRHQFLDQTQGPNAVFATLLVVLRRMLPGKVHALVRLDEVHLAKLAIEVHVRHLKEGRGIALIGSKLSPALPFNHVPHHALAVVVPARYTRLGDRLTLIRG